MTRDYNISAREIIMRVDGVCTGVPLEVLEVLIEVYKPEFDRLMKVNKELEERRLKLEIERKEAVELQRAIDILTNLKKKQETK